MSHSPVTTRGEQDRRLDELTGVRLQAALKLERDVAVEALRGIERTDKTPAYEYGEGHFALDRDGRAPERGTRWRTPREIARETLQRMSAAVEARADA